MSSEPAVTADAHAPAAEPFVLDRFLPYRLSVISNRVSRLFARRYSDAFGLSIPEWRVLAVIGSGAGATASALRERTAMDKVKISRAVAALLRRGLLKRLPSPGDRRIQPLALTPGGQAVFEAIVPLAREMEAELTVGLSAEEIAVLDALLTRLDARASGTDGTTREGGPDRGTDRRTGGHAAAQRLD